MQLRNILSLLTLLVFFFYVFSGYNKRSYILFILYAFPLIDLIIVPIGLTGFSLFDIFSYFTFVILFQEFNVRHNGALSYLFVLLAITILMGSLLSEFATNSLFSFLRMISIFIYAGLLIKECYENRLFTDQVVRALKFNCILSIFFIIGQVFIGSAFSFYPEYDINPNTGYDSSFRYVSFFSDPQKCGQFLAMTSFLFLINFQKGLKSMLINYSVFILIIFCIFLTGARAPLVGFASGILLILISLKSRYKYVAFVFSTIALLLLANFSQYLLIFNRVDTLSYSMDFRLSIWKKAFDIFLANPLFGIGIGNYQNYVSLYDQDQYFNTDGTVLYFDHPENGYLKLLTEFGVFGFLGACIFLFLPIVNLVKQKIRESGQRTNIFYIAALSSWLISFFTMYSLSDNRILVLMTTILCLVIVKGRINRINEFA